MAAPHVAGVAALMVGIRKANGQQLSPGEFETLLQNGDLSNDLGALGRDDTFGFGLIDAHKAVVAAGGTAAPASLAVSPSALNFRTTLTSALIAVSNGGGGTLTSVSVTEQVEQPWLSVTPVTINAEGLGTWRVTIDRSAVADGTYTAVLVVSSATVGVANVEVSVIMQDTTAPVGVTGDAGRHYVLLVKADTGETVQDVGVNAVNGKYSYSFSGVSAGNYQIYAGTNLAQTTEIIDLGLGQGPQEFFVICGLAEACGAYTTLDQPATLVVNASRSSLDFSTSFDATLGTASLGNTAPVSRALLRTPVVDTSQTAR
jgi:serine protease